MAKLFIVMDDWLTASTDDRSRLIGIFDSETKAQDAIDETYEHWETFDEGSQADDHHVGWFEYDEKINTSLLPDYSGGEEEIDEDDLDEE